MLFLLNGKIIGGTGSVLPDLLNQWPRQELMEYSRRSNAGKISATKKISDGLKLLKLFYWEQLGDHCRQRSFPSHLYPGNTRYDENVKPVVGRFSLPAIEIYCRYQVGGLSATAKRWLAAKWE